MVSRKQAHNANVVMAPRKKKHNGINLVVTQKGIKRSISPQKRRDPKLKYIDLDQYVDDGFLSADAEEVMESIASEDADVIDVLVEAFQAIEGRLKAYAKKEVDRISKATEKQLLAAAVLKQRNEEKGKQNQMVLRDIRAPRRTDLGSYVENKEEKIEIRLAKIMGKKLKENYKEANARNTIKVLDKDLLKPIIDAIGLPEVLLQKNMKKLVEHIDYRDDENFEGLRQYAISQMDASLCNSDLQLFVAMRPEDHAKRIWTLYEQYNQKGFENVIQIVITLAVKVLLQWWSRRIEKEIRKHKRKEQRKTGKSVSTKAASSSSLVSSSHQISSSSLSSLPISSYSAAANSNSSNPRLLKGVGQVAAGGIAKSSTRKTSSSRKYLPSLPRSVEELFSKVPFKTDEEQLQILAVAKRIKMELRRDKYLAFYYVKKRKEKPVLKNEVTVKPKTRLQRLRAARERLNIDGMDVDLDLNRKDRLKNVEANKNRKTVKYLTNKPSQLLLENGIAETMNSSEELEALQALGLHISSSKTSSIAPIAPLQRFKINRMLKKRAVQIEKLKRKRITRKLAKSRGSSARKHRSSRSAKKFMGGSSYRSRSGFYRDRAWMNKKWGKKAKHLKVSSSHQL